MATRGSLTAFSPDGFKRVAGRAADRSLDKPPDRHKALWWVEYDAATCDSAALAFTNTFSGRTKRRTNARYHTDPGLQGRIARFALPILALGPPQR